MADIKAWRLTRPKYAPGLDGLGAKKTGGRWNSPGHAVVYTASSLSLAVLETFVHLPATMRDVRMLPEMRAIEIAIPETLVADATRLAELPPALEGQRFGDGWQRTKASVVLTVPSAVVPLEQNYVLNPTHPDFHIVRLVAEHAFGFDPRLVDATA
ncbi:MAG: RES family NAD+ phosphorylase [Pseudomonadota bacterium]